MIICGSIVQNFLHDETVQKVTELRFREFVGVYIYGRVPENAKRRKAAVIQCCCGF